MKESITGELSQTQTNRDRGKPQITCSAKSATPTRKDYLPFHRPWIGQEEIDEVVDTLKSGWLTTGPKVKRFEAEFGKYVHAKNALAVSSCTAALHLSLAALHIGDGDEVITSPITWPSTANVVIHQRGKPVFADVQRGTLNIDPERIAEKITPRTKAIIPVHFAGHPCDMDSIHALAREHGLYVIEDAAHAIEAEYKGRKIGSLSDVTCFSFYPVKNITTGEGGMLTSDSEEVVSRAGLLSMFGVSHDAWKRYTSSEFRHWEAVECGYKYNMTDIQAAIGLQQIKRINAFWERRRHLVLRYDEAFSGCDELTLLTRNDDVKHSHYLYVVLLNIEALKHSRDEFARALAEENIGIGIHFRALHLQKYYRETFHFKKGDFPVAEWASDRVISLPLYPKMTDGDQDDVISAVHKLLKGFRR